jgi:hypothetical protein
VGESGRETIETIRQRLKADGIYVSINKLCQWFAVPRRTMYFRPTRPVNPCALPPLSAWNGQHGHDLDRIARENGKMRMLIE